MASEEAERGAEEVVAVICAGHITASVLDRKQQLGADHRPVRPPDLLEDASGIGHFGRGRQGDDVDVGADVITHDAHGSRGGVGCHGRLGVSGRIDISYEDVCVVGGDRVGR